MTHDWQVKYTRYIEASDTLLHVVSDPNPDNWIFGATRGAMSDYQECYHVSEVRYPTPESAMNAADRWIKGQ